MNTENSFNHDVVIIGSGPAGLTAATYLSRAGFKPLVITGSQVGGQLMLTNHIENFPGFDLVSGFDLMTRMKKQAEKFGTEVVIDVAGEITQLRKQKKQSFVVKTSSGKEYHGRTVLITVGASAQWLKVPGIGRLKGKGVSACAVCDGPFFKDKTIAVIGGGDTAFTEIEFLSRFAKKIFLIHRRENFRAEKILQDRALANKKVIPIYNTQVLGFLGKDKVTGLKLASRFEVESKNYADQVKQYPEKYGDGGAGQPDQEGTGTRWTLPVEGVFVAIGFKPNTEFLRGIIDLDKKGYIVVHGEVFTSIDGIFAAGDCADFKYRQAITAAGTGCKAAIEIEEWLKAMPSSSK